MLQHSAVSTAGIRVRTYNMGCIRTDDHRHESRAEGIAGYVLGRQHDSSIMLTQVNSIEALPARGLLLHNA